MSRETKFDRIARQIFEPVTEVMYELNALTKISGLRESDLERWCERLLKSCLGFSAVNGYQIRAQDSKAKARPDLIVLHSDKPVFVVEVKKLGFDLNKSDFRSGKVQLSEYLNQIGNIRFGILTNGYEWRLFDFKGAPRGLEIVSIDLKGSTDDVDTSKKGIEDFCWQFLDLHEESFKTAQWEEFSREASAFSPDSIAKAILSLNSVRSIAKEIRGEFDYKVNLEVLFDKIQEVVFNGLDDTLHGWNEEKEIEMNKFINSQKRASRVKKPRGTKTTSETVESENAPNESPVSSDSDGNSTS